MKHIIRVFVTVALLLAAILASAGHPLEAAAPLAPSAPLASPADDVPTATVNTGRLNVRSGPGVAFTIVTRIDQGQTMTLLGRNSAASWVKLRLPNGIEGWVNGSYIKSNVALADLPLATGSANPAPTPASTAATVSVASLDMRAGPGLQHGVVANLKQGQAMTLLGRSADSAWVKVRVPGHGDGWIPAQVRVIVPGNENGVSTTTFQSSASLSSLAVVATPGPRVSLSISAVRPASPIVITLENFPANRDVAAVLTSRLVPAGFVAASGKTDANGAAQLFFRMPSTWPSGAQITENAISLAVGATDGSVLLWSGLRYSTN